MESELIIEFVCTGNNGRSQIAKSIGKKYVQKKRYESRIKIEASGSDAKNVVGCYLPAEELISDIKVGLDYGTFEGEVMEYAKYIVDKDNEKSTAFSLFKRCNDYLMDKEAENRDAVLKEIGLKPQGPFRMQTAVRDYPEHVKHIILLMKESNAEQVRRIYKGSNMNPTIVPICEYAGIQGEISDPFGKSIEHYRVTRDALAEVVKKSIDRAVKEYLK